MFFSRQAVDFDQFNQETLKSFGINQSLPRSQVQDPSS
jgi:hypothetical protein